jgi:hypothetical protein
MALAPRGAVSAVWRRRFTAVVTALGPPLAALVLAEALLWTVALARGSDPRLGTTWVRWDSYRYVAIARGGYVEVPDDPNSSNTGWFPGFPLVMQLGSSLLSTTPARAGRWASLAFELGMLTLVWGRLLPAVSPARRWLALLCAAFFPGWFYRHAVFPMAMTAFFNTASLAFAGAGFFLAAGLSGAVSAFTYPTGFLAAAGIAVAAALQRGRTAAQRLRDLAAGPGIAVLGLVAVAALLQAHVGRWDAFLAYQGRFGNTLHEPLSVLVDHARPLLSGAFEPRALVAVQTLLVTLLLVLAAWLAWRDRESLRPADLPLLAHAAAVWVFVNGTGPNVSVYRQAAVLVSLMPLLARLPTAALALLSLVLATLGAGMARLFFSNALV